MSIRIGLNRQLLIYNDENVLAATHLLKDGRHLWQLNPMHHHEIGYLSMTQDKASLFFRLVTRRYEKGSIIMRLRSISRVKV